MTREERAKELFESGYNCAQAVFGAFAEDMGMTQSEAFKLSSSMGGGMGRLREVCGAVSGMFMALGALRGYDSPDDNEVKKEHYARVQALAEEFKQNNGSIICRELINKKPDSPEPTPRDAKFYHSRECTRYVMDAVRMLDEMLES